MFVYPKSYDVIVVGGGHAGIEAALASARIGCQTLLLTANPDTIGQMSCNPAIGGLAKGHLAREIDALGGEMGKCTDMTGIHFRTLNTSKGPAVQAPRAQCDKRAYQLRMKHVCEADWIYGGRCFPVVHQSECRGVETDLGVRFYGKSVVLTTGTFLRGLMHIGKNQKSGGRSGEGASFGLNHSFEQLGLSLGRLKTGTPPRLHRRSIDFSRTETQGSEFPVPWFSFWRSDLFHVEQDPSDGHDQRHAELFHNQDYQETARLIQTICIYLDTLRRSGRSEIVIRLKIRLCGSLKGDAQILNQRSQD
jgi:tRNA uridine 5-carboxymethylaminomethyl modification enzyme